MSASVTFENIRFDAGNRLSIDVVDSVRGNSCLWFQLPTPVRPRDDVIALCLATLCGKVYDSVEFDLVYSERCAQSLRKITGAEVTAPSGPEYYRRRGATAALNFSGGFDSLAVLEMMPQDTALISLDFGGRFARERASFSNFATNIVATNLVDLGWHRNSWEFMAVGTILLRDQLDLGTYAFGTVMEASRDFLAATGSFVPAVIEACAYLGLTSHNPVRGLTEIGTLAVAARSYASTFASVAESVANAPEAKYTRKILMMTAVAERFHLDLPIPELPSARAWYDWGDDFANDFLAPYLVSVLGVERVQGMYKTALPADVLDFATSARLRLYERFNPEIVAASAGPLAPRAYEVAAACGVFSYDRTDWAELEQLAALLSGAA